MMASMTRFSRPALIAGTLMASTLLSLAPAHSQQAPRPGAGKATKAAKVDRKGTVVDRVVAVVNDAIILESELAGRIAPVTMDLRSIADERERARRLGKLTTQMLDEMIAEELIVQAARESKITVDSKEVAAAVDEIKKQNNLDDAGLEQALAMQGMSVSSYRKDVERQIMRMRAVNMMVRPKVTITDEDVRARYDEMTRRSASVSKIHLKHIVIGMPANPSEKQVAEAKARAAAIIEQARSGASFDELAQAHSDDQATAAGGGDLGWIERGSLPTEWEVVVFSMDKGEVRGPISGPTGFHIFLVEDQKKSDIEPFETQKEKLRNELYGREMEKQTMVWLEELRKKAYISRKL
jgi:peptidyl-prolyl cis-trans isomerase SurA